MASKRKKPIINTSKTIVMDYSNKTKNELMTICKENNIKGYSGKRKEELLIMIKNINNKTPEEKKDNKRSEEKKRNNISKEDAERSASEWVGSGESLMKTWLVDAIQDPKQHRDIGKLLAPVAEDYVNKWITEKSGRQVVTMKGGVPYDGITTDDKKIVRNQIKFRMEAWHFETTRRNSKKNSDTNSTGHIAYKADEFDMLAIFIPGPTFGITGSKIRCIPVSELINPSKPNQLITLIKADIKKIYDCDEKTEEVIKLLY